MSLTIKGRQIRFSLKWLKPPPVPPDGSMTLFEHLRELRYRLVVACLAIIAGMVLSAFFYNQLFELLRLPYDRGIADLRASNPDAVTDLVNIGLASPFTLALKICAVAGAVLTAPIWLYQLWAFVVPGLLAKERKWALIFIGTATPLFLLGIATAYFVLPKAIAVLLGLHPAGGVQPAGHQHLPVLHAPADDRLRHRLPDPAAGADAQHRRRGQSQVSCRSTAPW